MTGNNKREQLNTLFGSYRAEWLRGKIFDFFAEPSYFMGLKDNRPCVLEGGRGTGKTTVLRGLSYQGQYAFCNGNLNEFNKIPYIGIYHRVDTNHVRAFTGGGLDDNKWKGIFAHYFNLITCRGILYFAKWHYQKDPSGEQLSKKSCNLISKSLHINSECYDMNSLCDAVETAMYEFQSKINNIIDEKELNLSMQGDPIKIITEHITNLPQYKGKFFSILLDEYENYTDYQQQIVNTLIKHNTDNYTFKIGVRELGWRIKHTQNKSELLQDPSDYILVNIEHKLTSDPKLFSKFAKDVCQQRIKDLFSDSSKGNQYDIDKALGNLTNEEEAELLGVTKSKYWDSVNELDKENTGIISGLPKLYIFFLSCWSKWHNTNLEDVIKDYTYNKKAWDTRYDNYKYSMLFKIRKGRGKGGIQKYYSGWGTYTKLAAGNIRYLMELVYRTYDRHLIDNAVEDFVSDKIQTLAAQEVGEKNLMELEGLWENGARITKLLLGLGRLFQVLAGYEGKQTPEVTQFSNQNSNYSEECLNLLNAAVMNLALIRTHGNKLDCLADTKDYIYIIHPIFSAYFIFSYRRKRKMTLNEDELLGLIEDPRLTLDAIIKRRNSCNQEDTILPLEKFFDEHNND